MPHASLLRNLVFTKVLHANISPDQTQRTAAAEVSPGEVLPVGVPASAGSVPVSLIVVVTEASHLRTQ